jgi:type I restriction enzyme S subunit
MKPYPTYKVSGLEWLETVPEAWSVEPLRNVTRFTTGWTPPTGNADSYEGQHLWANISDLGKKHLSDTAKRLSAEAIAANRIPVSEKGSLLFSFKLTIGSVSIVDEEMFTNEAIATFRSSSRILVEFAYYSFPFFIVRNANENIYGAPMLNARLIRSARLAIPPISEQRHIAEYLDAHTAKIDSLIATQEDLINALAERRLAVVSGAVSKGLDPKASTKESGVDWLNRVPTSWSVSSIRHIAAVSGGFTFESEDFLPEGRTPVVKQGDLFQSHFTTFTNRMVPPQFLVRSGDVLVAMSGDFKCVLWARGEAALNQRSASLRAKRGTVVPEWLAYSLPFVLTRLEKLNASTTIKNLSSAELLSAKIGIPSIQEQTQIVEYLNRETRKIDALSEKAREMVDVLKERRQALISSVATGKIDVRGLD